MSNTTPRRQAAPQTRPRELVRLPPAARNTTAPAIDAPTTPQERFGWIDYAFYLEGTGQSCWSVHWDQPEFDGSLHRRRRRFATRAEAAAFLQRLAGGAS